MLKQFLYDQKGAPSIETVAIVAFVAISVFLNLDNLGDAVGRVFDLISAQLTDEISG